MKTLSLTKVFNPNPGWYCGDFHTHTTFSDGFHPPIKLASLAKEEGLDFIAVTDHNAIDSFTEFGDEPGLLVIPGLEVTTTDGHWNVFGMIGWQEWMEKICTGRSPVSLKDAGLAPNDLLHNSSSRELLNSINHPLLKPWEWRHGSTAIRYVNCLEIWNDPLWPDNDLANPQAVALWTAWLNAGYRITAIAGSDFHFLPGESPGYPGERPGLPKTYVYAQELSGEGVLAGVRVQRVYVSMGPRLTFNAHANGKTTDIGGDLGTIDGQITFSASVASTQNGSQVHLVKNGQTIAREKVEEAARIEFSRTTQPDCSEWYRLDVVGPDGQVLAMTNPIYTGPYRQPPLTRYDDFVHQNQVIKSMTENDAF